MRKLFLLLVFLAMPLEAAVFTVTKTADTLDGACDADCSLREAIAAANATDASDFVVVPPGVYALTREGPGEDANVLGDLDVHRDLVLVGAGAGSTVLDGLGLSRVLDLRSSRTEIFGVTIRNGRADVFGGGGIKVRHLCHLLLRRSVVSGNRAHSGGDGGGIASESSLEIRDSAILDNRAEGGGGGIALLSGTLVLANATVSGNTADRFGGGLYFGEQLDVTVSSSTVAFNHAGVSGGGVYAARTSFPGAFASQIRTSVVALNTAPEDPDCHRARSAGYNVVGVSGGCAQEPTDRSGTAAAPLDTGLAPRSGAFGPTPVHPLLDGSPALDFVPAGLCEPADQAGQTRPVPCEAGAWESAAVSGGAVCVPGGSVLCLQDGRFRVSATWTAAGLPARDATAAPLTDDTGNYWFFSPDNLELMVKVVDGCPVNQRWWVFASGLTDRGVLLRVDDLGTGRSWTYATSSGRTYPPRLDTDAFPCAPAASPDAVSGDAAVSSAILVVSKTGDTLDGVCDHDCSLREAVRAANARQGMDVIVLGPGVHTLTREGLEEQGAAGDLDVLDDLLVLGAGAQRTILDGGGTGRIFDVAASLDLRDATVRNGRAAGPAFFDRTGGGIHAFGSLSLTRVLVTGNEADQGGGGIYAHHVLSIRDSTVSDNRAGSEGGGIHGGYDADLENVTVSGNQAGGKGGGLYLDLDLTVLAHLTVTGNSAQEGGGVFVGPLPCTTLCPQVFFSLERSVIAGNTAGTGPDCGGTPFYSGAQNVVGVREGCGLTIGAARAGTLAAPLDPRLRPLGFYGGPTPTHAPAADSQVLDVASCPAGTDQRGRPRPDSALCDAGSVERVPACQPDEDTLCLGKNDRFEVAVHWSTKTDEGAGKAVPLALDTGAFWFFQADNLELTVKVLDGCGTNNRFWVFLSGLTDVGVEVTVRDTKTGKTWTHTHAAGTPFQPRLDTNALEICE